MLPEYKRKQLDNIVSKMVSNKESDDNIQFVVDDFKSKYSVSESPKIETPQTQNPILGAVKGFAQEAGARLYSVPQNIGRVVSGVTGAMAGTGTEESRANAYQVQTAIVKKLRTMSPTDPKRKQLEDSLAELQKTTGSLEAEIASREQQLASVSTRPEALTPKTSAERAGATLENIAEFFIPSGMANQALRATKFGRALEKADDLNLIGKTTRSLLKGVGSGAELALKTTAQQATGELPEQYTGARNAFLFGLAASPVIDSAGALVKWGVDKISKRIPERLMSQIFKTSSDDILDEWRSIAGNKPLNPTLAKEALQNDIFGSSEKMGVYTIKKLSEVEKAVQEAMKIDKTPITIDANNVKKTVSLLKTISSQYKSSFTNTDKVANSFVKEISSGKIDPDTTLRLKRFFDGLRNSSSFRENAMLAPKQEELKIASNIFRKKLYDAGYQEAMNQERIFIEALDALANDAKKRLNKNVIGLFDLVAGTGGMVTGNPLIGAGVVAGARATQLPRVITTTARALYKLGGGLEKIGAKVSAPVKRVTKAVGASMLNTPTSTE